VLDALTDDSVEKWAFNANFERVCLSRYLSDMGVSLDPFADSHFTSESLGLLVPQPQIVAFAAWCGRHIWAYVVAR
jgi:hypothetical protein